MPNAKKLPSGNWRCVIDVGKTPDGKRRRKSFTATTKKEAEYIAMQYAIEYKDSINDCTVGTAIDNYIKSKDGVLSPTTIQGYQKIRKNNIRGLMDIKVSTLTTQTIQAFINEESKAISPRTGKPLSPKTIRNIHGLITSALKFHDPRLTFNVTLPQNKVDYIELPSAKDVFRAVKGSSVELPCMLALWLGLSLSEIRGIKYSSIINNTLIINRARVDVYNKPYDKMTPKTDARNRFYTLHEYLLDLLKKTPEYKESALTGHDLNLIPQTHSQISYGLKKALATYNLPVISFHKLRHLNASVMLMLNIPDKYAMERGGWATNHTMKHIYQHTFSEERKNIDEIMDSFFDDML